MRSIALCLFAAILITGCASQSAAPLRDQLPVLSLPNGPSTASAEMRHIPAALASPEQNWLIEQMPGGTAVVRDNVLTVADAGGCTAWFRQKLTAPVSIEYDVTVVARGGPHDRVSDVNCFWMASDPRAPDGCPFAPGHARTGKFADYDSLQTYYVGMGGNENTTTRFRRYDGTGAKPLAPQYDLGAPKFLLQPNHTYHLRLVARDGTAEYWRDGERIFTFRDPAPLTTGWFAIRTVKSHLEIRNLKIGRE